MRRSGFTLDVRERDALREAAAATTDRRHWRRIRALLILAEGRSVTETARMLGTTRQSVYNWIRRYRQTSRPEDLADRPRPGRPPRLSAADRAVLRRLLDQERPADHGYDAPHWTVRLLLAELERERGVRVSGSALRKTLHRMGYRWRGDAFVLAGGRKAA